MHGIFGIQRGNKFLISLVRPEFCSTNYESRPSFPKLTEFLFMRRLISKVRQWSNLAAKKLRFCVIYEGKKYEEFCDWKVFIGRVINREN